MLASICGCMGRRKRLGWTNRPSHVADGPPAQALSEYRARYYGFLAAAHWRLRCDYSKGQIYCRHIRRDRGTNVWPANALLALLSVSGVVPDTCAGWYRSLPYPISDTRENFRDYSVSTAATRG